MVGGRKTRGGGEEVDGWEVSKEGKWLEDKLEEVGWYIFNR